MKLEHPDLADLHPAYHVHPAQVMHPVRARQPPMADARNATAWLPLPVSFLPSQAGSSHPPVAYRVARLSVSPGQAA